MPTSETARAQRFVAYVDQLAAVLGHRDRHEPLRAYVTGLCLPGDRKSIEPMAARVDPRHVRARHQSMHHFIADAPWDAAAGLRVAREWALAPVAADAGYGDTTAFRDALTSAGLTYVVAVKKEMTAWPPGDAPQPPKRWKGRGRPPTRVRRTATHSPQSIQHLAAALPAAA